MSARSERRTYRCADCGAERYATSMPAGWQLAAEQYAGRHTVWCACGCTAVDSRQSAVDSSASDDQQDQQDQQPAGRVARRMHREQAHSVKMARRLSSWLAVALTCAVLLAGDAHALSGVRQSAAGSTSVQPRVNVNTASEAQLQLLPGVGPKLASEIYAYAEAGPKLYDPKAPVNAACDHKCHMRSMADLDKVKGIGPAKLRAMAPYVVFTGDTTATVKIKVARTVKP